MGFGTGQAVRDLPMRAAQPPQSATCPHGTTACVFAPWGFGLRGLGFRVYGSGFRV